MLMVKLGDAKELTKAINEATDLEWIKSQNLEKTSTVSAEMGGLDLDMESAGVRPVVTTELAQGIGGAALGSANLPEKEEIERVSIENTTNWATPEEVAQTNNAVREIVAVENGYAENGDLTPAENVVGGESQKEVEEREQAEKEKAKIESGKGLPENQAWIRKIAEASNKEIAGEVEKAVNSIVSSPDYNVAQLEQVRFGSMLSTLRNDGGHKFGDWN